MTLMDAAARLADAIAEDARLGAAERVREAEDEAGTRVAAARADAQRMLRSRRESVASASDELLRRAESTLDLLTAAEQTRDELGRAVRELADSATRPRGPRHAEEPWAGEAAGAPQPKPPPEVGPALAEAPPEAERAARPEPSAGPASSGAQPPPFAQQPSASPPPATRPTSPAPPVEAEDPLSSARLVALQLAVAGSSRADAARHLERELGLEDPKQIVDDVFGAYAARRSDTADGHGQ